MKIKSFALIFQIKTDEKSDKHSDNIDIGNVIKCANTLNFIRINKSQNNSNNKRGKRRYENIPQNKINQMKAVIARYYKLYKKDDNIEKNDNINSNSDHIEIINDKNININNYQIEKVTNEMIENIIELAKNKRKKEIELKNELKNKQYNQLVTNFTSNINDDYHSFIDNLNPKFFN